MPDTKRSIWPTIALIAAVVVIFAASYLVAPPPQGDESFPGTDSVVTQQLESQGAEPWFEPVFEPGSGEIESGLFALQAALGAGILGYVLGNLRGRAKQRELAEMTADQQ